MINNHPENQHNFRNIPRDVAANHREEKKYKNNIGQYSQWFEKVVGCI